MPYYIAASLVFLSFLPSLGAAAPLGAAAGLLAVFETGLFPREEDPKTNVDGSAGTHITPGTVGAIIGGAVGIILLLLLLCWCGRRRKW